MTLSRIGIYAGSFDPIHIGHVGFALEAITSARLERVYFIPERNPRNKPDISSYETRAEGVGRAIQSYPQLKLLDLADKRLSVHETFPELEQLFPDQQLVLLVGSDVITHMPSWPEIERLISKCKLIIGLRDDIDKAKINHALALLDVKSEDVTIVKSPYPDISSTAIRNTKS